MSFKNSKLSDKEFLDWSNQRMMKWLDESQFKGNKNFKAFRWNHIFRLIELAEKGIKK